MLVISGIYRKQRPFGDIVVEGIRTRIYDGTLEPGTRLVEREIAEEFDVSRLPVREALRILQNEGLVESLPTRGMIVCELSLRLVSELFDVREALESLAARQAARSEERRVGRERSAGRSTHYRNKTERSTAMS